MLRRTLVVLITVLLTALIACADKRVLAPENEFGSTPTLTAPEGGILPTVNPAKAMGWEGERTPTAAPGLAVQAFARGLEHPRWLYELPNGDVLVAESDAPGDSGGFSGIKGWVAKRMMKYAGSGVASADRITLLRDSDGDGVAETRHVFLEDLYSPFGMALVENSLFVANANALMRFPYQSGVTAIEERGEKVTDLPGGPLNHHWTKNVIASEDGSRLYVAVGSNSNIAENGMENEIDRAAILEVDVATGASRIYASGLRNPVGLAWHPQTGVLWTTVNERDELGDQLVPDYLAAVGDGDFFGWPYSYWGQTVDERVQPQNPELVATARAPDYALGAHTASLGLAFYDHDAISDYRGGALIGQHGSWNRDPRSGYKVVFVPFTAGRPEGEMRDVLTGFLSDEGEAYGRPAGVIVTADGAILVADDVGNTIWRVSAQSQ